MVDIVDDDPGNRKLLRLVAEREGYTTRLHATAEAALDVMRSAPPAVAVIDVQLPGAMDGLALIRALRATPATADVPLIVVSALASLADEARARDAGCDVWLAKPVDTREFADWVIRLADPESLPETDPEADPEADGETTRRAR